ncbi:hypothetical protein [Corynebacterium senegalense]|uniref:hypothetical protein n=1 Tax=Corynebacterium senegalense TaxID=2080750 RepID=UPI000E20862F|nr:hypothetical protein [Corynebacterium senegalense]
MAAPKADAFATVYDKATDKCAITFTDTNARRINDAYEGLVLRMGEQVRDGLTGEPAKADAQVVWEYGLRKDVTSATDLPVPADPAIPTARRASPAALSPAVPSAASSPAEGSPPRSPPPARSSRRAWSTRS